MSKKKIDQEKEIVKIMHFLFNLSKEIRYIAIYYNGSLELSSRPELKAASSSESDKYEEIIVNPTLLTLLKQRGEIDCGGVEYVIVRYGNFFQFIYPVSGGHVSIAFETKCNYEKLLPKIQKILKSNLI